MGMLGKPCCPLIRDGECFIIIGTSKPTAFIWTCLECHSLLEVCLSHYRSSGCLIGFLCYCCFVYEPYNFILQFDFMCLESLHVCVCLIGVSITVEYFFSIVSRLWFWAVSKQYRVILFRLWRLFVLILTALSVANAVSLFIQVRDHWIRHMVVTVQILQCVPSLLQVIHSLMQGRYYIFLSALLNLVLETRGAPIHTYTHTHTHTSTRTTHTRTHAQYTHTHIHAYTYTHVHTHMHFCRGVFIEWRCHITSRRYSSSNETSTVTNQTEFHFLCLLLNNWSGHRLHQPVYRDMCECGVYAGGNSVPSLQYLPSEEHRGSV